MQLEIIRFIDIDRPIGPAVIHCSAGIGRSGTFCIVDTALLQVILIFVIEIVKENFYKKC